MKTLIINGSTRRSGNTDALVAEFIKNLDGEYMLVTVEDDIAPCCDCRYCRTHEKCVINDRMQEVYRYFDECDNIVIASPVWFMSLSGVTINIASRFQTVWEAAQRDGAGVPSKNGVIMLVGAIPGTEAPAEKAARAIFNTVGVKSSAAAVVKAMHTDEIAVSNDAAALAEAREAAKRLNQAQRES